MMISADDRPASSLVLRLARSEVIDLSAALADLLARYEDPGFHAHVSSEDYQTEITVTSEGSP